MFVYLCVSLTGSQLIWKHVVGWGVVSEGENEGREEGRWWVKGG